MRPALEKLYAPLVLTDAGYPTSTKSSLTIAYTLL